MIVPNVSMQGRGNDFRRILDFVSDPGDGCGGFNLLDFDLKTVFVPSLASI